MIGALRGPWLAASILAACSGSGASDADTGRVDDARTDVADPDGAPSEAPDSAVAPDDGSASEASDTAVGEATTPTGDDVAPEVEPDAVEPGPWPSACVPAAEAVDTIPLPEASGSARLPDGRIVVVADSGNAGRAVVLDPALPDGAQAVTLPLGEGAGDDVEGLETAPDGRVWGLTSAGWLRAWRVEATRSEAVEFVLEVGPVAVAPEGDWRCAPTGVNCGPNYEGLCLHPAPEAGACAGWAASKARGVLVCLVASDGAFVVDPTRTIAVAPADQLSGCAYEPTPPHRLIAGGNVFSGSLLWEVDVVAGHATPFTAIGAANQETVLVNPGGVIHSYGDLQELSPDSSPHITLRCPVR